MKITVGGKEVDLAKALPITLGDLRRLKEKGVNYPSDFDPRNPDHVVIFVLHFCQKVVPESETDVVEALSINDSIEAVNYLVTAKEALDRPTFGSSTSSDGTTVRSE